MLFRSILMFCITVSILSYAEEAPYCAVDAKNVLLKEKEMLLEKYAQNPHNPETLNRLGHLYELLGDSTEAHLFFEKCTHVGSAPETHYQANFYLAQFFEKSEAADLAHTYYLKAHNALPDRAEPLVKLARHYQNHDQPALAYYFAKLAASAPYPPKDSLPFSEDTYLFDPCDIIGQVAWYIEEFDEGEKALRELISRNPHLDYLKNNLQFYINRKNEDKEALTVDFHKSMSHREWYTAENGMKLSILRLAKQTYDDHILKHRDYSETPRIPKIIHQIWLGNPLPEKERILQKTWFKHHPDWEYRLWTEKEIDAFGLTNRAAYDRASNYGEKSDIARYEILNRIGGVYVDMDFECVRPFDILHHVCDFYTGLETEDLTCNALIGSAPNHPVMQRCVEALGEEQYDPSGGGFQAVFYRTGPVFFTNCIEDALRDSTYHSVIFPVTYFFSWRPNSPTDRVNSTPYDVVKHIKPETFAIHRWHSSWTE